MPILIVKLIKQYKDTARGGGSSWAAFAYL